MISIMQRNTIHFDRNSNRREIIARETMLIFKPLANVINELEIQALEIGIIGIEIERILLLQRAQYRFRSLNNGLQ